MVNMLAIGSKSHSGTFLPSKDL